MKFVYCLVDFGHLHKLFLIQMVSRLKKAVKDVSEVKRSSLKNKLKYLSFFLQTQFVKTFLFIRYEKYGRCYLCLCLNPQHDYELLRQLGRNNDVKHYQLSLQRRVISHHVNDTANKSVRRFENAALRCWLQARKVDPRAAQSPCYRRKFETFGMQ